MKSFSQKTIATILIFTLISGFVFMPKSAKAFVPVIDPTHIGTTATGFATQIAKFVLSMLKEAWRWAKQNWQDAMRDRIAKMLINRIVDQIINWVQGGGEPRFVSDWKGFLNEAANTAIGRVIQESDLAFLCSPFRLQLKLSLLPGRSFRDRIGCTLDDVIANIENFYEDFTRGGWIAYNTMWQPNNNYYGQILLSYDEMLTRAAEAQEAAKNEALAGSGFLSVKKCKTPDTELLNQCRDENPTNPDEMCPEKDFCREWEIQTPGDIVGEAAAEAVKADIEWAANIKSWVSAIINAIINRLIGEGLSLMRGGDYDDDFGSTGYYYPPEYIGLLTSDMRAQAQGMLTALRPVQIEIACIATAKQATSRTYGQIGTVTRAINRAGCQTSIGYSSDISQMLNREAIKWQMALNEINSLIDEINNSSSSPALFLTAQGHYLQFSEKYDLPELQAGLVGAETEQEILSGAQTNIRSISVPGFQGISIGEGARTTCQQAQAETGFYQTQLGLLQSELDACTQTTSP